MKRVVHFSISATPNCQILLFFCGTLLMGRYPVCPPNGAYATAVPVLEGTIESGSLHIGCTLPLVWVLHGIVELLSIMFKKHVVILRYGAERQAN